MDPKDLKNSDELRSIMPDNHKQLDAVATIPVKLEIEENSIKIETDKDVNLKKEKTKTSKKKKQPTKVKKIEEEPEMVKVENTVIEEEAKVEIIKAVPEPGSTKIEAKGDDESAKPVDDTKEQVVEDLNVGVSKEENVSEIPPSKSVNEEESTVAEVENTESEVDKPAEVELPQDNIELEVSKPEKEEVKSDPINEKVEEKREIEVPVSKDTPVEDTKAIAIEELKKEDSKEDGNSEIPPAKDKVEESPLKKTLDYSTLSQIELVDALRDLLEEKNNFNIKNQVESIKSNFYKLLNIKVLEQKEKFIQEGGLEEEFIVEKDPYEQDIKDLIKQFRQQRIDFGKRLEGEKDGNLREKYEIIEDIKNLINNEESINKTFNDFRDLQIRWRRIGLVPQLKMKDLWDTYHFHVENFYDYIKINKELRDLDLRKNLEIKITLCENAEELLAEPSIIRAFNTLQKYHEEWREVGPVPREQKEDIWERFKAATSLINKKHQEFFESRKSEQKRNLEAKTLLCEKAEELANKEIKGHKEWDERSKALVQLQKGWRTIGFAPKRENNRIYERFRNACDKFFESKREFYTKSKELQQNNLQLKIDLCVQAESLKDNDDWKKTTQDFINIQKSWKEIGPVPRKYSDIVWKRFRNACDLFFENKSHHFSSVDGEQVDNLKAKEKLIEQVTNFMSSGNIDSDLKTLKSYQREWTEIGHVPIKKKDEVQNKFRETIHKHYDNLNLDDSRKNILKFRNKVSNFSETSQGQNKMRFEREKFMSKLKQMESDLVLFENNIGFFSQSKNAESLIADVNKKIDQAKEKIEFLKNKIRIIDEYDGDE